MSGIAGLPQSRRCAKDQSSVRMIALAPAARARSRICSTRSREPNQYIWKNSFALAAITSSTGLLANELRPIAVPAPAAARATATSPSGVHGLHAGRRDQHRQRQLLPENGRSQGG